MIRIAVTSTFLISLLSLNMAIADEDPAEIAIGERLFLETRFAQAYFSTPDKADPALDNTITTQGALRGPFAGKTMNCRACHMVDEHAESAHGGMRTYADYAAHPPVPKRNDRAKTSGRNSMALVNISKPHETQTEALFHFDGQFNNMEDLVRGTLTGRNYGWLVTESEQAIRHIAKVIREDDGKGELAQEFGGSYKKILTATDNNISTEHRLSKEFRVDVNKASDKEIFNAVAKLIAAYSSDLAFAANENDEYNTSPYDAFLMKNNLPAKPNKGESLKSYNQRLIKQVNNLKNPIFVSANEYTFKSHKQKFVFAKKELQGMKVFFAKSNNKSAGNCASCHTAPHFSDYGFHNSGLVQHNYDALHGHGAFNKLTIPNLLERNKNHNQYLPATSKHPHASSRFKTVAAKENKGFTDLGLWNIYANPDMPAPQKKLTAIMCFQNNNQQCTPSALLPKTIAAFKTPVLRDLGHSNPYMHTGQFDSLAEAVRFYITSSQLAKSNQLRNAENHLKEMSLSESDVEPLVAFIKSLNEDYD